MIEQRLIARYVATRTMCLTRTVRVAHICGMKLADYLAKNEIDDTAFAEAVGRDRTSVLRWRKGSRLPDNEAISAIFSATNGQVTANDFFHDVAAAPEVAA